MMKYLPNIRLPFNKSESESTHDSRLDNFEMQLPRLGTKPKAFDLGSKKLQTHLSSYAMEKSQQVREALKYLEQLNKIEVKVPNRLELTNNIIIATGQSLSDIYRIHSTRGTSIPEKTERRTDLTSTIALIQNLIISYKIIVVQDYNLPTKKFSQQVDRVNFVLLKIFELTLWLQRVLAIRFQKLSSQNWKDINSVFFIYANHFDIYEVKQLTEQLSLYKASGIFSEKSSRRSIGSIYLSIQIFGLLDISSWPSNALQSVEQYLEKYEELMTLSLDDNDSLPEDTIVTYLNHYGAPLFEEGSKGTLQCRISISRLKNRLQKDLALLEKRQFIGDEEKKRLKPQGKIDDLEDNAGLLQLFLKNLSKGERSEERKALYGSKIVYIYNGLAASYRLLYEQMESKSKVDEHEGHFHNAAARHSSLLVDSESDVLECQWRIINESDGGALIRTVETKYMHRMEVGQLVAVSSDDEMPQLGFITRLDRLRENEIDVAIVKVSSFAESVTILEPGQEINGHDLLPGILIKNLANEWQLILPRYVEFVAGTPIIVKRNNDHTPVRLGKAVLTKNGFIMFEARSPGLN